MIRIVTAARLDGLHADLNAADERNQRLLETLGGNWVRYLRSVLELNEERVGAERVARAATEEAEGLRRAFTAAVLVMAQQQRHIGELEQQLAEARTAPSWLYLLRSYGEPHSLHPSQEAAKEHAVTCGARRTGWGPSNLPPAETAWRVEAVAVVSEQERATRSDAA
ncbi:hypothetical protein ACH4FX_06845 [Streptomyces sp. NPDC018019]|uniref:hypothetical protein n=1 Tax=Streptomyces sp. NPDC018019 TaxID=3365030 RepID=UPI003790A05E